MRLVANTFPVQQSEFAMTDSEMSLRLFVDRVLQIPGVVSVKRHRAGRLPEEGVTVVVTDLFSTITKEVIHVQESVYDAMPGVRFNLEIKDASTVKPNDV